MSGLGLWEAPFISTPALGPALTDLARIPQVKEAHKALVAHLLVRGEHDDIAPKVKATGPDS